MIARIAVGTFGLLLLGLVGLVFVTTLVLGWQVSDESDPAGGRVFTGETLRDDTPPADVAGTVSDVDGDVVLVRVDEALVPVRVGEATLIQALLPIAPEAVEAGDWLIVGATDDNVNTLVLQAVVVAGPDEVTP